MGNSRRLQGLPSLTLKVFFLSFLEISGPACRRMSRAGPQDLWIHWRARLLLTGHCGTQTAAEPGGSGANQAGGAPAASRREGAEGPTRGFSPPGSAQGGQVCALGKEGELCAWRSCGGASSRLPASSQLIPARTGRGSDPHHPHGRRLRPRWTERWQRGGSKWSSFDPAADSSHCPGLSSRTRATQLRKAGLARRAPAAGWEGSGRLRPGRTPAWRWVWLQTPAGCRLCPCPRAWTCPGEAGPQAVFR